MGLHLALKERLDALGDSPSQHRFGERDPTAITDADGRFEITLERPGTITLRAVTRLGENSIPTDPIAIFLGQDVDGIVITVPETGKIFGTVTRHDGTPGAALSVHVVDVQGAQQALVLSDAEGRYLAPGLAPGSYTLYVTHELTAMRFPRPAKAPADVLRHWSCEVLAGKSVEVDITLAETALAHLRFDLPAQPGEDWFIQWATHDPRTGEGLFIEAHHPGGVFDRSYEFVDPCRFDLTVQSSATGSMTFKRATAELSRGSTEFDLAPKFGQVQGRLLAPVALDEQVHLTWEADSWSADVVAEQEPDGSYRFQRAPAGACRLSRSSRPGAFHPIEVVASEVRAADDFLSGGVQSARAGTWPARPTAQPWLRRTWRTCGQP